MRNLYFLFLIPVFFSCRSLAPNRMFQTDKDFAGMVDTIQMKYQPLVISPHDRLELNIFSNDGFRLVDITQSTSLALETDRVSYLVDVTGEVRLPVIGNVKLQGMTIQEAEHFLEVKYSKYYNNPYILLKITNRHVIVFHGDGGRGQLVNLTNDQTTLLEALALAGGITDNGKAYRIKIIRGSLRNPEVHFVDISTIDGMKKSEMRVFSNDIIYVEAAPNYKQRVFQQLTPLVGILTAFLLVLNLIK